MAKKSKVTVLVDGKQWIEFEGVTSCSLDLRFLDPRLVSFEVPGEVVLNFMMDDPPERKITLVHPIDPFAE